MNNPLVLTTINGEARIRDIELAERLGFAESRMIRKLIKYHNDKLLNFGVCYAVEQTSGTQGGRPSTEFYLNQKQALFVCMKSETDKAFDVQVEIIRIFDAYLNGELAQPMMSQSATDDRTLVYALRVFNSCQDAFAKQVTVNHIQSLCRKLGLEIPSLALLGKPATQFNLTFN